MYRLFLLLISTATFILYAPAQQVWRPFSADSPWNQKIPADAQADKNSPALIADFASRGPLYINIKDWSVPLYIINSDTTPKYNVGDLRPGVYGKGFEFPRHIPIPDKAQASLPVNGDNHLCIIDTAKSLEWDMWWARQDNSGQWFTGLGAVTDLSGSGVARPWFAEQREFDAHRARAGGFPLSAGLIRVDEIKAGKIEHASFLLMITAVPNSLSPRPAPPRPPKMIFVMTLVSPWAAEFNWIRTGMSKTLP